jgi:hypothetical protein
LRRLKLRRRACFVGLWFGSARPYRGIRVTGLVWNPSVQGLLACLARRLSTEASGAARRCKMRRPEKPTLQRRNRLLGPLPLVSPGACESWALNMSAQFDGARVLVEEPSTASGKDHWQQLRSRLRASRLRVRFGEETGPGPGRPPFQRMNRQRPVSSTSGRMVAAFVSRSANQCFRAERIFSQNRYAGSAPRKHCRSLQHASQQRDGRKEPQ